MCFSLKVKNDFLIFCWNTKEVIKMRLILMYGIIQAIKWYINLTTWASSIASSSWLIFKNIEQSCSWVLVSGKPALAAIIQVHPEYWNEYLMGSESWACTSASSDVRTPLYRTQPGFCHACNGACAFGFTALLTANTDLLPTNSINVTPSTSRHNVFPSDGHCRVHRHPGAPKCGPNAPVHRPLVKLGPFTGWFPFG